MPAGPTHFDAPPYTVWAFDTGTEMYPMEVLYPRPPAAYAGRAEVPCLTTSWSSSAAAG